MKVLHTVESYYPSVGGMQEVVKRVSELLASKGHDITVATSYIQNRKKIINNVKIKEFKLGGNLIGGITGEIKEQKRYVNYILNSDFDIITNFAAQQWATDLILENLSKIKSKKVFVPTGFSAFYDKKYIDYFTKMKEWMHRYDMNIFLSNKYRDINFAKKVGVKKLTVIPNGASSIEFSQNDFQNIRKKLGIPVNHFLIICVGSHTGVKGHFEAMQIFKQSKIRHCTLLIIGNRLKDGCYESCMRAQQRSLFRPDLLLQDKKMLVKVLNRVETVSAYKEADLMLFPSNIECSPIVLFEAMASLTPYLVTDVGNSKEIISWSKSGKLLPTKKNIRGLSYADISKSALILEDVYKEKFLRKQLGVNGYNAWKIKFTWEIIAEKYESLYNSLIHK